MFICYVGRSIVWLQNKRDATLERSHGPNPRRDDSHEYRIGRLKHERVKIPRQESLINWATRLMEAHRNRKSVLEVGKKNIYLSWKILPKLNVFDYPQMMRLYTICIERYKVLSVPLRIKSCYLDLEASKHTNPFLS